MNERGSFLLKFFDKYVGIPLLFFLRFFRFKKSFPSQIQTIAILKTAAIGDTVLLTGIVKDLRAAYPKAKIILFTGSSNYAFAKLLRDFDDVIKLPLRNIFKSMKLLRQQKIDLFLDFGAWPRINSLFAFLSGAQFLVGFKTKGQYRHYIYDQSVEHLNTVHELENYRNIMRSVGIRAEESPLVSPKNIRYQLYTEPSKYVVCHLSAGGEKSYLKELPVEHWEMIGRDLLQAGYKIYLTGAPADKPKNEKLLQALNHIAVENIAGTELHKTIEILSGASCVISVNTGIMHIASCMGLKTIGIHGPTSVKRWGPLGENSFSVVSKHPNAQYLNLGFEYKTYDVMSAVSLQEIRSHLQRL